MRKILTMPRGMNYEKDASGTVRNIETGKVVTLEWVYPVKQAVWGGASETYYFATVADRNAYCKAHDYCDKLPRCKVYSDCIDTFNPEEA